ncbi:slightly ste11-like protein [Coemansia sp. IMI 209128]|nr:slightly ste11-like protein [Coemansia sp. IMI 209128]
MQNHAAYPYAGDQCEGQQALSSAGSGYWSPSHAYLAMPPLSMNATAQTTPSRVSPQVIPDVASIKGPLYSDVFVENSPNFDTISSSKVPNDKDSAIFTLTQDSKVMEHKVRQFYSADGTSFIEHVPGHCLVFIPNTTNVDYVFRELRKARQPKPKPKPKDRSPKPTNAFIKYRNHKIDDLKSMHPDISQTEISRMAGECWRTEPLEVKNMFQKRYQEEKRIYDMNKAKRARTDGDMGSDAEAQSDGPSSSSPGLLGSPALRAVPQDANSLGLGLGLGGNSVGPAGFNPGRRRSHTLPPGGFCRSGTKRRISQELRKHLATKSNNAYLSAASAYNGLYAPDAHVQPFPTNYEFTFAPPQVGTPASSTVCMDPSPFMPSEVSPMLMPLNPNFPIAEFSGAVPPTQNLHHHARSLSNIPAGLQIDTSAFASGFESYDHTAVHSSLAKSLAESQISAGLSMIDTSALSAFSVADTMPINAFAGGYLTADAVTTPMASTVNPWPMQHSYTLMPDSSSTFNSANNNNNLH